MCIGLLTVSDKQEKWVVICVCVSKQFSKGTLKVESVLRWWQWIGFSLVNQGTEELLEKTSPCSSKQLGKRTARSKTQQGKTRYTVEKFCLCK